MRDVRGRATAWMRRWESLPPGSQLRRSYVASVVVLALVHLGLVAAFHRITWVRAISYAVFESILVAGAVTIASQAERARRAGEPPDGERNQHPGDRG